MYNPSNQVQLAMLVFFMFYMLIWAIIMWSISRRK